MDEKLVRNFVLSFSQDGVNKYEKTFSVNGVDDEVFTLKIERKRKAFIAESVSMESRFNAISALPPGAACDCCNGSGRSS